MPYRLIKDTISHDLIEALEVLLEGARQGDVIGIAFACALKRNRFITNVAGVCYRNAAFTRGMVASLDDELSELVQGRDANETR